MKYLFIITLLFLSTAGKAQTKPDECPTGFSSVFFIGDDSMYHEHQIPVFTDCWHADGLTFFSPNNALYRLLLRIDSLERRIKVLENWQSQGIVFPQTFFTIDPKDSLYWRQKVMTTGRAVIDTW